MENFTCPECESVLRVEEPREGVVVDCRACGQAFELRRGLDGRVRAMRPPAEWQAWETPPNVEVRPWVRYWARWLDCMIFAVAVGIVFSDYVPTNEWVAGFVIVLAWLPVEAALLSTWGTTPGKWLLATEVRTEAGDVPGFLVALRRSLDVWVRGLGLGLGIISLFTCIAAYRRLKETRTTAWDATAQTVVRHHGIGAAQVALAALFIVGFAYVVYTAGPGLERDIRDAIRETPSAFDERGATARFLEEIQTGSMAQGDEFTFQARLEADVPTMIYAMCDNHCMDIDIEVADTEDLIVALDAEPDAEPFALWKPKENGMYTVTLTMYDCRVEPCYYGVGVVALDGLDLGPRFGTCFVVSPDGLVVTAEHVIDTDSPIWVQFSDGSVTTGQVVDSSASADVALVWTGKRDAAHLPFADPAGLALGQDVFTVGFPVPGVLGAAPKFTEGSISSLAGPAGEDAMMQISVPVQPGNSGGALVNDAGEVVGIISSTANYGAFQRSTGALPQNVSWAVKGSYAADLLAEEYAAPAPADRAAAIGRATSAACAVRVGEEAPETTEGWTAR